LKFGLKWVVPVILLPLGFYLLFQSYRAYGKWYYSIAIGDPSSAELYEIDMWLFSGMAGLLLFCSIFLIGRWSVKNEK